MSESPVAIVTGGAQGLGAAITVVLLKKGYKVCIADILEDKGKQCVKNLQEIYGEENIIFTVCDVTKQDDYRGLFDFTIKKFDKIDLVVNNAGIVSERNPQKCLEVNLLGPIIGCKMAIEYMGKSHGGKGGMVINIASLAGFLPFNASPVYSATKHGIIGLTRSYGLPYHLKREGIIFAALCPYFIDTEMVVKGDTLRDDVDDRKMPHLITPEYVAESISKLLEDRINGSTLTVTEKSGYKYFPLQEEAQQMIKDL